MCASQTTDFGFFPSPPSHSDPDYEAMAPGITLDEPAAVLLPLHNGKNGTKQLYPEPLKLEGTLEGFKYDDSTPAIGREYSDVNIVDDLLNSPNGDERLRDLAIIS